MNIQSRQQYTLVTDDGRQLLRGTAEYWQYLAGLDLPTLTRRQLAAISRRVRAASHERERQS